MYRGKSVCLILCQTENKEGNRAREREGGYGGGGRDVGQAGGWRGMCACWYGQACACAGPQEACLCFALLLHKPAKRHPQMLVQHMCHCACVIADDFLAMEEDMGDEGGGADPNASYDYSQLAQALEHNEGAGGPSTSEPSDLSEADTSAEEPARDGDDLSEPESSSDDDDIMERALVGTDESEDEESADGSSSAGEQEDDGAGDWALTSLIKFKHNLPSG